MKRLTALLTALLILLMPATCVRAAVRGKFSFSGVPGNVKRGDAFTLTLRCGKNPGVQEMRLTLSFDRQVLKITDAEETGLFPGGKVEWDAENAVFTFRAAGKNKTFDGTGDIAKVSFSVRENAPFGATRVGVTFNERILDIHDAGGKTVPFDVQEARLELACPHANTRREILSEATLISQGVSKVTCDDCGESWEEFYSAEIESEDGRVRAVLSPNAFSSGSDPKVAVEYIFGGSDSDAARSLFGARLIRAFRIRFTAAGAAALPREEVLLSVTGEVELPEYVSLYAYADGGLEKLSPGRTGNTLTFPYRDALFLLVNTPPEEEPVPREEPETSVQTEATVTRSPEEKKRRRDGTILAISAAVLLLSGAGIALLLRRSRRY